ncbi:4'-phosphopantetheinyl transferase family protein [Pseudoalteromonas sp. T1lg65]|uniref:4'-phosphopantetheinyl transferase family protein n=1 Tax=Pseudoalteromonas sp. T1lg65 TaxID=2077101 RepID=UPI003F7A0DD3
MQIVISEAFTPQLSHQFHCVTFDPDSFRSNSFIQHSIVEPISLNKAVAKRKAEFLAGRICARECLGLSNATLFKLLNAEDRSPIWPPGVIASITHTRGIAAAAVSRDSVAKGIGIDIERDMSEKQELELQKQILHSAEYDAFQLLSKQIHCPLTIVFSAKESIYKALYPTVKRFFGFDAVKLITFTKNTLTFELMETLHQDLQKSKEITVYFQTDKGLVLTECQYS